MVITNNNNNNNNNNFQLAVSPTQARLRASGPAQRADPRPTDRGGRVLRCNMNYYTIIIVSALVLVIAIVMVIVISISARDTARYDSTLRDAT